MLPMSSMKLVKLSQSDRRTIELITERHPDIKDDLSRVLKDLDKTLVEEAQELQGLREEVHALKQEIEDLKN